MTHRIVQIASSDNVLFALDVNGRVWQIAASDNLGWTCLPELPRGDLDDVDALMAHVTESVRQEFGLAPAPDTQPVALEHTPGEQSA